MSLPIKNNKHLDKFRGLKTKETIVEAWQVLSRLSQDEGDVDATIARAVIMLDGIRVQPQHEQGLALLNGMYRESHNLEAAYLLGFINLYGGYGVEANATEADNLLRHAASEGHSGAAYEIGNMYYQGLGVARDYSEAQRWLKVAVEASNADALVLYGKSLLIGGHGVFGDSLQKDEALGVRYLKATANAGVAEAKEVLIQYYARQILSLSKGVRFEDPATEIVLKVLSDVEWAVDSTDKLA